VSRARRGGPGFGAAGLAARGAVALRAAALLLGGTLGLAACPGNPSAGGSTPPTARARPPATRTLLILSLNDFHGHLAPHRVRTYETPGRMVRVGGAAALVATVAEIRRQRQGAVLMLDAGDFMQGSVLSNSFEGAPVRALYRRLGVDAAAIGNHEFDFGPRGPKGTGGPDPLGALKAWARGAPFPLLSANLTVRSGAKVRWPDNVRAATLVRRAGVTVGVIGLTTRSTPGSTHPANLRALRFAPLAPAVLARARELRRRGAEAVVLLAHVGGACPPAAPAAASAERPPPTAPSPPPPPTSSPAPSPDGRGCRGPIARLVRALPRGTVDAVLAAHSHRCFWHRIRGVPVVQAGAQGIALGRVELRVGPRGASARALPPRLVCHDVFSDDGGCEAHLRVGTPRGTVTPSPLLARHARRVADIRRVLQGYRRRLRPRPDQVIARAAAPIPHHRHAPSPMGQRVAEILHRAVPGADAALVNAGGVRAGLPAGPITHRDLYRVFPFDNQLAWAEVTGRELRRLVQGYLGREGGGLLLVSGLRYRVRCGDPDTPKRLVAVTDARGRPLRDDRRYRVVLSDFLLQGGDGFAAVLARVPASHKKILSGRLVRDAIRRYVRAHPGPLRPPAAFPVTVENGPCAPRPRPRTPRHLCR
jgi:5'-nucleotidase